MVSNWNNNSDSKGICICCNNRRITIEEYQQKSLLYAETSGCQKHNNGAFLYKQ